VDLFQDVFPLEHYAAQTLEALLHYVQDNHLVLDTDSWSQLPAIFHYYCQRATLRQCTFLVPSVRLPRHPILLCHNPYLSVDLVVLYSDHCPEVRTVGEQLTAVLQIAV